MASTVPLTAHPDWGVAVDMSPIGRQALSAYRTALMGGVEQLRASLCPDATWTDATRTVLDVSGVPDPDLVTVEHLRARVDRFATRLLGVPTSTIEGTS